MRDGGGVVYDADGLPGVHLQFSDASWLDNSHVVGLAEADGSTKAVAVDIESGDSQVIGPPHAIDSSLADGHGAVAFSWTRDNKWPDAHFSYVVWHDGDFSDPLDGYPQVWSSDGSKLALLHQFGRNRSPDGWLSVVSWPGSDLAYADAPPWATGNQAQFDPTGRYIAFPASHDQVSGGNACAIRVVDLEDASSSDLPCDGSAIFFWTSDENVVTVSMDRAMITYSPSGDVLSRATAPFWGATASSDGSTVVYWDVDSGSDTLQLARAAATSTIQAPARVDHVYLSPDGSRLIVEVAGYQSYLRVL